MAEDVRQITVDPKLLQAITDLARGLNRAADEIKAVGEQLFVSLEPTFEILQRFGELAKAIPLDYELESAGAEDL